MGEFIQVGTSLPVTSYREINVVEVDIRLKTNGEGCTVNEIRRNEHKYDTNF
jgi:hypothetical protein